jgi:hypothetical protein
MKLVNLLHQQGSECNSLSFLIKLIEIVLSYCFQQFHTVINNNLMFSIFHGLSGFDDVTIHLRKQNANPFLRPYHMSPPHNHFPIHKHLDTLAVLMSHTSTLYQLPLNYLCVNNIIHIWVLFNSSLYPAVFLMCKKYSTYYLNIK